MLLGFSEVYTKMDTSDWFLNLDEFTKTLSIK